MLRHHRKGVSGLEKNQSSKRIWPNYILFLIHAKKSHPDHGLGLLAELHMRSGQVDQAAFHSVFVVVVYVDVRAANDLGITTAVIKNEIKIRNIVT